MAAEGSAAPLAAGQLIDDFRLEERLHQGGMASLWRVTRVNSPPGAEPDPPLIMKVPRIKGGEDPATIVGFEVEQMIMPRLSGPHVPRFVAKGDFTRQPYIVMEHIPGETLRPRLDRAPLPVAEVLDIARAVAAALQDLHRQRVVHLDIKPSNVLFRADGKAVLIDFGLSRHEQLPDLLEEEFTIPMGTGPYISPEQLHYVRGDPRSDLFALGVMLYHLSTGRRPFGSPDSIRGLRKRLYVDPVPPRARRADCPPWLQELILKCLEIDPAQRYQSAAQLLLDLQDPQQIALSARAALLRRSGWLRRGWRWLFAHAPEAPPAAQSVAALAQKNPIVMAAVDVENAASALLVQLRDTVQRLVLTEPGARLACVSVMRTARIGMDERTDAQGQSRHLKQLVALKHWARPLHKALKLEEGRLTFHVLEAPDAAAAIIEFARRNEVDHIVMGARGSRALRRYLGSVSSQVVAQSDCSVTVVRAQQRVVGE